MGIEPPFRDVTIGSLLTRLAAALPGRPALVYAERDLRWTFARLEAEVRQVARGLLASGVGPGERVAVWATNVPEWIGLQFALAKIGAILVTVDTGRGGENIAPKEIEDLRRQHPVVSDGTSTASGASGTARTSRHRFAWRPAPARRARKSGRSATGASPASRSPGTCGSPTAFR